MGGSVNTFVGNQAGLVNTIGADNTFVGGSAGISNVDGRLNTFIGVSSGNTCMVNYAVCQS